MWHMKEKAGLGDDKNLLSWYKSSCVLITIYSISWYCPRGLFLFHILKYMLKYTHSNLFIFLTFGRDSGQMFKNVDISMKYKAFLKTNCCRRNIKYWNKTLHVNTTFKLATFSPCCYSNFGLYPDWSSIWWMKYYCKLRILQHHAIA